MAAVADGHGAAMTVDGPDVAMSAAAAEAAGCLLCDPHVLLPLAALAAIAPRSRHGPASCSRQVHRKRHGNSPQLLLPEHEHVDICSIDSKSATTHKVIIIRHMPSRQPILLCSSVPDHARSAAAHALQEGLIHC